MTYAVNSMQRFLMNFYRFFVKCMEWLVDVLDIVTDSPALTVFVLAMPIVLFSVSLFRRLIRS